MVWPQGERAVVACKRRFILALCRLDDGQNMSRVEVIGLEKVLDVFPAFLDGKVRGRLVVDVNA